MTYDNRWLLTIPLLILSVSAVAVHQNIGQDQQTACIPDAPDASQEVNVLDVEELIAEYTLAVNAAHAALERGRWADAAALTPPPGAFAWSRFPQAWAATYVARAIVRDVMPAGIPRRGVEFSAGCTRGTPITCGSIEFPLTPRRIPGTLRVVVEAIALFEGATLPRPIPVGTSLQRD